MTVEVKMNYNDMCVSVHLKEFTDYTCNAGDILDALGKFLRTVDNYEVVNIEIKREAQTDETLDVDISVNSTIDYGLYPGNDIRVTLD